MEQLNNSSICQVCGSENVEIKVTQRAISAPYGMPVPFEETVKICNDCGSEIDETKDSDVEFAIEKSKKESVMEMLNFLSDLGYSLANIERSLDLPQRTISRWKSTGDLSSVGVVLLRILRTYPWILDVAENKFETNYAQLSLITNAFDSFSQIMESATNLYLKGGGLIAETASGAFSPSNLCVFINYEEKIADVHNTNDFSLESSDPTIFEEVKNENC